MESKQFTISSAKNIRNLSISQVGVVNEPKFIKREVGPMIDKERPSNVPSTVIEIRERSVILYSNMVI